jgi:hypothetical protein
MFSGVEYLRLAGCTDEQIAAFRETADAYCLCGIPTSCDDVYHVLVRADCEFRFDVSKFQKELDKAVKATKALSPKPKRRGRKHRGPHNERWGAGKFGPRRN